MKPFHHLLGTTVLVAASTFAALAADQPKADSSTEPLPVNPSPDSKPTAKPAAPLKEDLDFEAAARRINIRVPTNEPWKSIAEEMREMRVELLQDLHRLLGLTLPEGKQVVVTFATSRSGGTWGFTGWRSWGAAIAIQSSNPRQQRILLSRPLLQHEMTHALQNAWLPRPIHAYFPNWIIEGLATYAAGHGPRKLRQSINSSGNRFINGLGHHQFGAASDYAEAYLAFVFLGEKYGPGAVREFTRAITIHRTPWKEALKNVTNMEWEEFEAAARNFSLDFVAQVVPARPSKDAPPELDDTPPPQLTQQRPQLPHSTPPASSPSVPAPPAASARVTASSRDTLEVGVHLINLDESATENLGMTATRCVMVVAVMDETPAARAGLESGDIIVSVNGQPVKTADDFFALLKSASPARPIAVQVFRGGTTVSVQLNLEKP